MLDGSTGSSRVYSGAKKQNMYAESPFVSVTSVTLPPTEASMTVGGETLTLTPTVLPDNATDKTVTWTTSDESVATVADGVVTAVAAGTATITATANDGSGVTATCAVTVTVPTLAELLTNGAVVKVTAAKSNNTLTYTVQGTYNGSSFDSVTQSNSFNNMEALNQGASLTKSGNNLVAEIKTPYGSITFTFDTTNNTYTLATAGSSGGNAPTILNSITVNGNAVTVTKSN